MLGTERVNSEVLDIYNEIWDVHPEILNDNSTIWWFILLFPEGDGGFNKKQIMATLGTKVGKNSIQVNNKTFPGIDPEKLNKDESHFWSSTIAWFHDGKNMHDNIICQPVRTTLKAKSNELVCIFEDGKDSWYSHFSRSQNHFLGLNCKFEGKETKIKAEAWSEFSNEIDTPVVDIYEKKVGFAKWTVHIVSWRKLKFEGTIEKDGSTERIKGTAYFQRVILNMPLLPWKWTYSVFDDGSVFSAYLSYFGLQNLRKKFTFLNQTLERLSLNFSPSAYFYNAKTDEVIKFTEVKIVPELDGSLVNFYIKCSFDDSEDYLNLYVKSYDLNSLTVDKKIQNSLFNPKWFYNEFLFEVKKLKGIINNSVINLKKIGKGWGNMEYTWGMTF